MLRDSKTYSYAAGKIARSVDGAPKAQQLLNSYRAMYSRRIWLIMLVLCLGLGTLYAGKMHLKPYPAASASKKHPYTALLRSPEKAAPIQRNMAINNRLLVLLVDFEEELTDDPNTTGNGKFQLEADPNYLYSIAAPPHDRQYFERNLEAMRYYYLAASAGTFDLQYEVWPRDKAAYTLPHTMGYYNPVGASSSQFVAKMEEYFKTAFELADLEDPELDFSSFGHYMIIHAGSDWQHDALGDSPSDLPSFFIRVGAGKEAVVDGGATLISHACNVPATISQDLRIQEENGVSIHAGYGALNSVLFHEFGHSLGLVDLYNVYNFYPMVGAFDIMDSGGAGVLVDQLGNGDLVLVEGALPALPGAFSRSLLFGGDFQARGLMRDVEELSLNTLSKLAASSLKQGDQPEPSIIRFRLNPDEYYLLENRSVDPDGDGGTALFGDLDNRVILYPTAIYDDHNLPTYEYDYLLPSFMKRDGSAMGGGIIAWHVNEKVLYKEGRILEDGSFWSNYDNNTVNTNFHNLAVQVLEADGLRDIGEPYSYYWTGTPYEYFHARKPELNSDGLFLRWGNEAWRPALGAHTSPAMLDRAGLGSLYFLDEISDPATIMTFKLKSRFFPQTASFESQYRLYPTPAINSYLSDLALPFWGAGGMRLFSRFNDEWQNLMGEEYLPQFSFDYPLVACDNDRDGYLELAGIKNNVLMLWDYASPQPQLKSFTLPLAPHEPLVYENELWIFTDDALYFVQDNNIQDFCEVPGIRQISRWRDKIALVFESGLSILDVAELNMRTNLSLPEAFGDYKPLTWYHGAEYLLFLVSNAGNIYSFDGANLTRIFNNNSAALPTQPALYQLSGGWPQLFFGLGKSAYLIRHNGYLESGFPLYLDAVSAQKYADNPVIQVDGQILHYLPVARQGYLAISDKGKLLPEYNLLYPHPAVYNEAVALDYLHYDAVNSQLLWYHGGDARAYIHSLDSATNPILWKGRTQGESGTLAGKAMPEPPADAHFDAYIFPNPVKTGHFRLRALGAVNSLQYSIYDISGALLQEKKLQIAGGDTDLEIDVNRFSSGVYILRLKSGSKSKVIKFAIEK